MRQALWLSLVLLVSAAPLTPRSGAAEPVSLKARALWVHGDRVYVALLDTLSVSTGHSFTFRNGKRLLAAGTFTGERAGDVIAVRLHSGTLDGVKRLERLLIWGEQPPTRAPRTVRWGYPSAMRRPLLFACRACSLRPERLGAPYRIEAASDEGYRLVREPPSDDGAVWPDTVVVRLYDQSSDQEIAFERGDIDAAVFWPGEASRHARDLSGPTRTFIAPRNHGVVIASAAGSLDDDAFAPLSGMNLALFRGDLIPYLRPVPEDAQDRGANGGAGEPRSLTFEVDPGIPGARMLRRALDEEGRRGRAAAAPTPVRVSFLPVSIDPDSIAHAALRSIPGGLDDGPRSIRLFTLGCPVLARAALVPFLERAGVGTFVNLFDCVPNGAGR